ncbi:DUF3592 domain-containing protein [Luteolibacter luteus]|uniref:DUF3592 domain-containing protein n=1 Tax=Luteolibacter luteus TaxID=2728835 RepID=A0A858RQT5_9BACT|nr:DUF3592 domain-containing protein [Luteolibacter luteus]QJE98894.1 DUF3592 domain-containing protein [Luteolibacter luteus]
MPDARTRSTTKAVIEWIVFGALVALGICFFCGLIVPSVHGYWRTRSKTMVPARLSSVELVKGGRTGRKTMVANYEYDFGGRTYRGDRISLWGYTRPFHREFDLALRRDAKIRVYVDPATPSYSVYDREFRLWPFAGAVLMVLGTVGMGTYGLRWCWKHRNLAAA